MGVTTERLWPEHYGHSILHVGPEEGSLHKVKSTIVQIIWTGPSQITNWGTARLGDLLNPARTVSPHNKTGNNAFLFNVNKLICYSPSFKSSFDFTISHPRRRQRGSNLHNAQISGHHRSTKLSQQHALSNKVGLHVDFDLHTKIPPTSRVKALVQSRFHLRAAPIIATVHRGKVAKMGLSTAPESRFVRWHHDHQLCCPSAGHTQHHSLDTPQALDVPGTNVERLSLLRNLKKRAIYRTAIFGCVKMDCKSLSESLYDFSVHLQPPNFQFFNMLKVIKGLGDIVQFFYTVQPCSTTSLPQVLPLKLLQPLGHQKFRQQMVAALSHFS